MCILVAGTAILAQPQKGICVELKGYIPDIGGLMAFYTFCRLVFLPEFVAGQVVVKRLFVKPDHVKVNAVMLRVTGDALLAPDF